jgi:hypothetical protein
MACDSSVSNCEFIDQHSVKKRLEARTEMMRSSISWSKLISCISSIMHVLLTVFAGYLISAFISARSTIDPLVFVFAATSKLFAVMFTENRDGSKKTRIYSTIALASLFPLLIGLTNLEITMGILILMLYSLYPLVNGKAPFDAMHHILRYVFIFVIGYGSQAFFNETALSAILAIVLFSLAGELLAGLRKNSGNTRNAASILGSRRSSAVIVFSIFTASLAAAFVFNDLFEFPIQINEMSIPFYVIPALVMDVFLTAPLMKALLHGKRVDPFHVMRRRELMAVLIGSVAILAVLPTGRTSTMLPVSSRDYSFDVGIRTYIAGPHGWDVPWIVFDYVNESNYYYVVFHKDGFLELSQKVDGQTLYYESSLKTQLTPFQWHNFHILLNETTITVRLDGEYEVSTTRNSVSDTSSIIVSPSTGFWTACTYDIKVNT